MLFRHQLRQIPNCSLKSANAVSKQFPTAWDFMDFLRQTDRPTAVVSLARCCPICRAFTDTLLQRFLSNLIKLDHMPSSEDKENSSSAQSLLLPVDKDRALLAQEGGQQVAGKKCERIGPKLAAQICDVFGNDY